MRTAGCKRMLNDTGCERMRYEKRGITFTLHSPLYHSPLITLPPTRSTTSTVFTP